MRPLTLRYRDLYNIEDNFFHIPGCGAVGSNTAENLARMGGLKFALYDMDEVGAENIGVSAYLPQHVGQKKVAALAEIILSIEPKAEVEVFSEPFSAEQFVPRGGDCILLSFDSMAARKEVAEAVCNFSVPLFVDSRMGAETLQMYSFVAPTIQDYMKHWYSDDNADEEPCTRKATSYCASIAGGMAASMVRKAVQQQPMAESVVMDLTTFASNPEYK